MLREKIEELNKRLIESRQSQAKISQDGEYYKNLNEMQELVIADLIKLMRSSVNDLSIHYVNAGQEALKFCRDPLALMEARSAKTS